MKMRLVWLFVFFVATGSAETFFFAEQENVVRPRSATPQVNFWIQQSLGKSKWGLFSWSQASQSYQLAEGGVSYQIKPWIQAGVGGGAENVGTHERFVTFAFASKGKNVVFATYENGGSGRWHQAYYIRS